MFCPECESEYKQGISVCPDCGIDLVEKLPMVDHESEYDFVEILETMNQGDLSVIESILESNEIEYLFSDENFNTVTPLIQPVKVLVKEDKAEDAIELLKDLDIHIFALSTRPDDEEPE